MKKSGQGYSSKNKGKKFHYLMYFHTHTKLKDNEPYWSGDLSQSERFAIDKKDIADTLQQAQTNHSSHRKQPVRIGKTGHVFVLKLNSTKLRTIKN